MSIAYALMSPITVKNPTGTGSNGMPTYGTGTTILARINHSARKVYNKADGTEIVETAKIYVNAGADIQVNAQITLPDGEVVIAQDVHPQRDGYGTIHHRVVII